MPQHMAVLVTAAPTTDEELPDFVAGSITLPGSIDDMAAFTSTLSDQQSSFNQLYPGATFVLFALTPPLEFLVRGLSNTSADAAAVRSGVVSLLEAGAGAPRPASRGCRVTCCGGFARPRFLLPIACRLRVPIPAMRSIAPGCIVLLRALHAGGA
eukprot:gene41074-25117_t